MAEVTVPSANFVWGPVVRLPVHPWPHVVAADADGQAAICRIPAVPDTEHPLDRSTTPPATPLFI